LIHIRDRMKSLDLKSFQPYIILLNGTYSSIKVKIVKFLDQIFIQN
jgi:hypothetical protein